MNKDQEPGNRVQGLGAREEPRTLGPKAHGQGPKTKDQETRTQEQGTIIEKQGPIKQTKSQKRARSRWREIELW